MILLSYIIITIIQYYYAEASNRKHRR